MNHQARDEMNITGQPVQLGDGDRTTLPARFLKGGGKLLSPVDGIGPFAGLDLDAYPTQLKAFGGGEPLQCLLLRLDSKAGFTLLVPTCSSNHSEKRLLCLFSSRLNRYAGGV
jgi:hypothetical protein